MNYQTWDYYNDPEVCTTHLAFVPCRKGHVGEFWGVGCSFSTDPNEVALVAAWHRGEIDDSSSPCL